MAANPAGAPPGSPATAGQHTRLCATLLGVSALSGRPSGPDGSRGGGPWRPPPSSPPGPARRRLPQGGPSPNAVFAASCLTLPHIGGEQTYTALRHFCTRRHTAGVAQAARRAGRAARIVTRGEAFVATRRAGARAWAGAGRRLFGRIESARAIDRARVRFVEAMRARRRRRGVGARRRATSARPPAPVPTGGASSTATRRALGPAFALFPR